MSHDLRNQAVAPWPVHGKFGVVGFCMGGAYAVALAPGHGYPAASVNYGGCPKNAGQALAGACPIGAATAAATACPWGAAPRPG